MRTAPILFITLVFALFLTACGSSKTANNTAATNRDANSADSNSNPNALKYDIEELELTIKLPFHPEDAVWREETLTKTGDSRVPAPTDKKLFAILLFLKDDANKIAAQAEKYKAGAPEILTIEQWYPAELIAQSQMSGDETLKGKSYPATDFLNPPYTDGKITRIDGTDYFIVELYAK